MHLQTQTNWLGINWQINLATGWGVLALNLALEAVRDGRRLPVPIGSMIQLQHAPPHVRAVLERLQEREKAFAEMLHRYQGPFHCGFPVMHNSGNWISWNNAETFLSRIRGTTNLAVIFIDDTKLTEKTKIMAEQYDLLLAGSSWNTEIFRRNNINNVVTYLQGVDLAVFRPRPKASAASPFFVFSGGKIEFRKGQDIVVAAFREFHRRHPDSVLVFAWHNLWPESVLGIERKGLVSGQPRLKADGNFDFLSWLEQNGIPRTSCFDVGVAPNYEMPEVLHQVDVAVFPNRAEGGTNLVAMECLACGIPTILSANTGHLDLIDDRHCYPLIKQTSIAPVPPYGGTEGWGESDVDEVVEALERVYRNRQEAQDRAAAAVRFMQEWSWTKRYEQLLELIR